MVGRRLPWQFARSSRDRQRSRRAGYRRRIIFAQFGSGASGNEVLAVGGCTRCRMIQRIFSPCSLPPTTTSQLTCFSYFQDSRGEVKLALLPPCNLPLRHYHSTAAPMHLSPRSPQSFLSRGISAHITKMLFACSETRVETLTNRVLVMN